MSRASRDLSKGIAVKSNGFKYGGGGGEGWGTGGEKGRRLGKGQGARDVAARERLRARLEARRLERSAGSAAAVKPPRARPKPPPKRKRAAAAVREEGTTTPGAAEAASEDDESPSRVVKRRSSARDDVEAPGSPTGRAPGSPTGRAPGSPTGRAPGSPSVLDGRREAPAAVAFECATCGVRCGSRNNYDAHVASKKHKARAQRERGREMLAAMRAERESLSLARRTTPSDERGAAAERPPEEVG